MTMRKHFYAAQRPRGGRNEVNVIMFAGRQMCDRFLEQHKNDGDCKGGAWCDAYEVSAREARKLAREQGDGISDGISTWYMLSPGNMISSTQYGANSLDVGDGTRIDVHWTFRCARGNDNVTLTRVRNETPRPTYARQYADADVIAQTHTAGFRGKWTLYLSNHEELKLNTNLSGGAVDGG
jgi:hypothetical protein